MTKEIRNLKVTKIALVRKGYRPVNDGARIEIVKAEEDTPMQGGSTDAGLVERFIKAMRGLFAGEAGESAPETGESASAVEKAGLKINEDGRHASHSGTHSHRHSDMSGGDHEHEHTHAGDSDHAHEHVQKAQTGTHVIADDGSHGRMNGIHAHSHFHGDGQGGAYSHEHEHTHDDNAWHYHDYEPGHEKVAKAAKGGCECEGVCKEGCPCDGKCGASCTCECPEKTGVAKAAVVTGEAFATLSAQVAALVTKVEAGEEIAKAAPTPETLRQLVGEQIAAALEPVVKAIEDLGIERARRPVSPNVTAHIDPRRDGAAESAERAEAVKGMSFGEAVRYLAHH